MRTISAAQYIETHPGQGAVFGTAAYGENGELFRFYRIDQAALFGEYPVCLPLDAGTYGPVVLDESVNYSNIDDVLAHNFRANRQGDVISIGPRQDNCALLYQRWTDNIWHWITEALPKAVVLEQAGFAGSYIMPPQNPIAWQSMELMGIGAERLLPYEPNMAVSNLFITQKLVGGANLGLYPRLILALRQQLIAGLGTPPNPGARRRIYIRRTHSRRVTNEAQLQDLLRPYGFETLVMEQMPLAEQIGHMVNATCLITPHGAGTVHCLFMPPRATVIELFAPHYINPVMLPAIRLLTHRYHMVPSFGAIAPWDEIDPARLHPQADLTAFLEAIETILAHEFGAPA